jgi:hypothetical protein
MTPPGCDSVMPRHWALAFTDSLAEYMVNAFQQKIALKPIQLRDNISLLSVTLETLCEADRMVGSIVSMYENQCWWIIQLSILF